MRKTTAAVMAALILALAGCGEKKQPESVPEPDNTPAIENVQDSADDSTGETTSSGGTTAEITTAAEEKATASAEESTKAPGSQEDSQASGELTDQEILETAESLYRSACETEWSFTVGSPFALDTANYVENGMGWRFYLVTEEGIGSMDDVYREYHKIFAEEYADHLDELFLEENGRVYCLNGARGSDIFYSRSEIVDIREKTEGRVVMTVTDLYDGTDLGEEPYSVDRDFVIVDSGDGWRVAEFTLPY
ncbi:MAG: hypothetical protein J6K77_06315 [Ruminococcus sp.]|nr:hypothetical protein [Ruminococcus sp.]